MDEQKNGEMMKTKGGKCLCGCDGSGMGCGCGWHHGHMLFRVLIGFILLVLVFWFGVRLGELREIVRGGGYGTGYYGERYQGPMMGVYSGSAPAAAVPGTSATTGQ